MFPAAELGGAAFGEVRAWTVLFGLIVAGIVCFKFHSVGHAAITRKVWRATGLIVLVQGALLLHTFFLGNKQGLSYFAWEMWTLILSLAMLAIYYQLWGAAFVVQFMWVALVFAIFSTASLWSVMLYSGKAINEVSIGTTFSFYRIQIFGGFAALFLYFRARNDRGLLWALLLSAAICFAGAFLSLSKAALLSGAVGILILAAVYSIWFDGRRAVIVLAVLGAAVSAFYVFSGRQFAARVNEGVLGKGYVLTLQSVTPISRQEILESIDASSRRGPCKLDSSKDCMVELIQSEIEAQRRLAKLLSCTAEGYDCDFHAERWERDLIDAMLMYRVYIPDFTFRMRLLMHGAKGILNAPWLGNGFGNFHKVATNLYTKAPEHYYHPHNIIVELLYAVGLLGALMVCSALFLLVRVVLSAGSSVQVCMPLLAFVVTVTTGSLFGGDYFDFRLVWFGLILCVMLCEAEHLSS